MGGLPSILLVRPTPTSSRSAQCAAVYPNAALFHGAAAAVARYEITSAEFIAALQRYDHDAYGSGGSLTS